MIAKFLWVTAAAFGKPVVPLVAIRKAGESSGSKSEHLKIELKVANCKSNNKNKDLAYVEDVVVYRHHLPRLFPTIFGSAPSLTRFR